MPEPGRQHARVVNPYEEVKPQISEYTATEIATLSCRLEKQLGPEYISSRQGPNGAKVYYLAADKCINLANEVFGFNGWSSSIQNIQVDFVDEAASGKISLGLSVTLRVTLKDGTYHEDIGYGHIENCKGKAAAFEKAKKEGTTDALKRTLRNFGNILGNCVYDKEYLAKVTKIKTGPTRWDPENLHRHSDFAPVRGDLVKNEHTGQPSVLKGPPQNLQGAGRHAMSSYAGLDDEFGSDDFDAADFNATSEDHPDEVTIDGHNSNDNLRKPNHHLTKSPRRPVPRPAQESHITIHHNADFQIPPIGFSKDKSDGQPSNRGPHPPLAPTTPGLAQSAAELQNKTFKSEITSSSSETEAPVGFFTARAAPALQTGPHLPATAAPFNPHLESPSIRKTAGIDHTKTKPVNREAIGSLQPQSTTIPNTGSGATPLRPTNIVDPQTDRTRKIGMPGAGAASPLQNRSSYKPPLQIKRPAESSVLRDVTSITVNASSSEDMEGKRLRTFS